MTPVFCTVKQDPENGLYGDCVRACVASILDMKSEDVPHFYHDGDGDAAFDRMRAWLADHGRIPAYFPISEKIDPFAYMADKYADVEYMLFHSTVDGDHCIVGRNDKIAHNPAWFRTAITGAHSQGVWIVIILARL